MIDPFTITADLPAVNSPLVSLVRVGGIALGADEAHGQAAVRIVEADADPTRTIRYRVMRTCTGRREEQPPTQIQQSLSLDWHAPVRAIRISIPLFEPQ